MSSSFICKWSLTILVASAGCASQPHSLPPSRLIPVYSLDRPCNGITIDPPSSRAFVALPPPEGNDPKARLAEIESDNSTKPFPDSSWNDWTPGQDAHFKFVFANSLRIVNGTLWVIDVGAPGMGKPPVPGGPKLVAIDVNSSTVQQIISLDSVVNEKSFVDDARFTADRAYVTDAGWPGLIVVDLKSGTSRRVLNDHPAATDLRTMRANGKTMLKPDGSEVRVHADQLELSPDGRTLYFQPASGPMSKIATKYLDDRSLSPAQVAVHVEQFYNTPTTGGTAIDSAGTIYVDDCDHNRVLRISPRGASAIIVEDPRLQWGDAMWIDRTGFLWIPAAQLNRTPGMNHGVDEVKPPVRIYKLQTNAIPVEN